MRNKCELWCQDYGRLTIEVEGQSEKKTQGHTRHF
jgi:hypothetical protein